jgi:hypothetical protein
VVDGLYCASEGLAGEEFGCHFEIYDSGLPGESNGSGLRS